MSPRDRILARRAKFLAAATAASVSVACSSAEACLKYPSSRDDAGVDAQVCLEPQYDAGPDTRADTAPMPCLSMVADSGSSDASDTNDSASDTSVADTFPMPCLVPPLDSGS